MIPSLVFQRPTVSTLPPGSIVLTSMDRSVRSPVRLSRETRPLAPTKRDWKKMILRAVVYYIYCKGPFDVD